MEVTVTVQSKQLTKEELRALIQGIRDSEQKSFPDKEIYIWIDAPELSRVECEELLTSIKPPYKSGPFHLDLR